MNYAQWLQQVMAERKLTQSELARRTGIPQSTISNWFQRRSEPKWSDAVRIAEVLGIAPPPFSLATFSLALPGMPIVGEVGAGPPRFFSDDSEQRLELDRTWQGCVLYRVYGVSMRDQGIFHGDYLVVRPVQTGETEGKIVVAYIDALQGHVVKRHQGRFLTSDTESYPLTEEDRILGVLVGVLRVLR